MGPRADLQANEQKAGLGAPLIIAGAAKIAYDLMLWIDFRRVKPPEEQ